MLNETNQPSPTPSAEAPAAPEAPPKRTLNELLTMAKASDDGLLAYDLDLDELGTDIRGKVDGIVEYVGHLEERAAANAGAAEARLKRVRQLQDKADAYNNRIAGLLNYVARNMAGTDTKLIPGTEFKIARSTSESVDTFTPKPDAKAFLKFKGLVRRAVAYTWDKDAIKKALKAKDAAASQVATIKVSQWAHIKARSEGDA